MKSYDTFKTIFEISINKPIFVILLKKLVIWGKKTTPSKKRSKKGVQIPKKIFFRMYTSITLGIFIGLAPSTLQKNRLKVKKSMGKSSNYVVAISL